MLEKYFDQAEYWLRPWTAPVVRVFTFGYINPRQMVATEVRTRPGRGRPNDEHCLMVGVAADRSAAGFRVGVWGALRRAAVVDLAGGGAAGIG